MKLLGSGFSTAETTLAGTTGGSGSAGSSAGTSPPGAGSLRVRRIAFSAGSSVAPNSSGGIGFRYGQSSGVVEDTLVLVGGPSSVGIAQTIDGLDIQCNWFEAFTNEAGAMGYSVFVFGD